MRKIYFYYIFWIKSSRGTDDLDVRFYKTKPDKETLNEDLERWCSTFGAWHHSDNMVSYGWKPLTILPKGRRELLKMWHDICQRKESIQHRYKVLRGLLGCKPYNGER